ncbi:hypothetical protein NMK54_34320 [Nocardia otitidiscaviarum]|uniref:hypothetical protein n=1 Tax=Nocardia otitidiscaviarum TaxID=1823 RepID=UPI0020CEA32E|nr:hypothetical protein [Nocardia otitidiscaviarum]MCP9625223.1 hypothetical protein [Nocardia otitidiscaviarum]
MTGERLSRDEQRRAMMLDSELVGDLLLIATAMEEAIAMWAERRQAEQDSNVRQLTRRKGTSLREIATLTQGSDTARARAWVKATIASDAPTEDGRRGVLRRHLPILDWDSIYGWATDANRENGDRVGARGRVASAVTGQRTSTLMPSRYRSRRRCYCGCGGKATHTGRASGVPLVTGCELSMQRWVRTGEISPTGG